MHIVRNGIDVPDELVRAHEEGRVVFFCGAGISYEAGLDDFENLTKDVFRRVGERMNSAEKNAAEQGRWDAVLGSLENRIADRTQMRRKLMEALTPDKAKENFSVATHRAILDLAFVNDNDPHLQLVTTNFDLLFEPLIEEKCGSVHRYSAPFLPTPRKGLWNGLVYLHGKLPDKFDWAELQNLVVASGDYGRAYLSEAWASRFVAELLRNYVVCFVGYSIGDQTIRYLMDAVDVYHRIGDKTEKVYVFTDSKTPDVLDQNKSLVRINYNSDACGGNHAVLHQTLQAWARRYKAGLDGRFGLVRELARINPADIPDDGYVDQMLWALRDEDPKGQRALQFFVNLDECPSFGWLDVLEKRGFLEDCVFLCDNRDLKTCLLCFWILRMMGSREVVLWAIKNQRRLSDEFWELAERRCNSGPRYGGNIELDEFTKRLWRLIIAKRVDDEVDRGAYMRLELGSWISVGKMDCMKRERIREVLKPSIKVQDSYLPVETGKDGLSVGPLRKTISFSIGFQDQSDQYLLKQIRKKMKGRLFEIVYDAMFALEQSLDEYCYLHGGDCCELEGSINIPSIEDHWQNDGGMRAMPHLAAIIRDGWMELAERDRERARTLALTWIGSKHLLIKRFGLHAAKATDVLSVNEWVVPLISWHGYLLWDSTVKREVLRLISERAKELSASQLQQLTDTLVKGLPACRTVFLKGRTDDVEGLVDHSKFVRLSKLKNAVGLLPENGERELTRIHEKYPTWIAADDESDEFVVWGSWTGDPTEDRNRRQVKVPHEVDGLVGWLKDDIDRDSFDRRYERDDFEEVCLSCQDVVLKAFTILAENGLWNVERIYSALKVWSTKETVSAAARYLVAAFPKMSENVFGHVANQAASWCEDVVKADLIDDGDLLAIGNILLDADYEFDRRDLKFGEKGDLISTAINHPVGRIMSALIDKVFPGSVHKGDGINPLYRSLFEVVANSQKASATHGRLILASRGIALYYADEEWARRFVLNKASWDVPLEARAFWQGFLWQRSMHVPLLLDIKVPFLETINHCDALSDTVHSYISLVMSLALLHLPEFPDSEMEPLIRSMKVSQLEDAAQVVESHMRSAAKSEGDVDKAWREGCWPIICGMWPQDAEKLTEKIQDSLTMALLNARDILSTGLDSLWFLRSQSDNGQQSDGKRPDGYLLLTACSKSECVDRYPWEILEIIYRRMKGVRLWTPGGLDECLSRIARADANIVNDKRYIELKQKVDYVREQLG